MLVEVKLKVAQLHNWKTFAIFKMTKRVSEKIEHGKKFNQKTKFIKESSKKGNIYSLKQTMTILKWVEVIALKPNDYLRLKTMKL